MAAGQTGHVGRQAASSERARHGEPPVIRRLRGRLRIPPGRLTPRMLRDLEPYVRDADDSPGFKILFDRARLLLYEARRRRQREKLEFAVSPAGVESRLSLPERERVRVLNRELGRLALN